MKFKTIDEHGEYVLDPKGRNVYETVIWSDHYPSCKGCREVDLGKPASFVHACAHPGAALLNEELQKRQAPVVAKQRQEVKEWARKTGVFKGA